VNACTISDLPKSSMVSRFTCSTCILPTLEIQTFPRALSRPRKAQSEMSMTLREEPPMPPVMRCPTLAIEPAS
jgi:hypothetical protein